MEHSLHLPTSAVVQNFKDMGDLVVSIHRGSRQTLFLPYMRFLM